MAFAEFPADGLLARFESRITLPPGIDAAGWWYVVGERGAVLVDEKGRPLRAATRPVDGDEPPLLMGTVEGVPVWAVGAPALSTPRPAGDIPDEFRWQPLMGLGAVADEPTWLLAGRAVQLVEWARTHRFCGRCGAPVELAVRERAAHCLRCGLDAYPRLAPAVIVIVERNGEILLARGAGFRGGMFSALAGFVEPGESLEQAVRRELREEVAIEVSDIRYFASQPWPFPHSLMIGFFATWASGELTPDGDEIVEAGWFAPGLFPPIPPPLSIARQLIDEWVRRQG